VRMFSTVARIGVAGLLGLLLTVMMDPANWNPIEGPDGMTTLEFSNAILNDWAFTLVILGALLTMAMAGAAYLIRDERLINLLWEISDDAESYIASPTRKAERTRRVEVGGEEE